MGFGRDPGMAMTAYLNSESRRKRQSRTNEVSVEEVDGPITITIPSTHTSTSVGAHSQPVEPASDALVKPSSNGRSDAQRSYSTPQSSVDQTVSQLKVSSTPLPPSVGAISEEEISVEDTKLNVDETFQRYFPESAMRWDEAYDMLPEAAVGNDSVPQITTSFDALDDDQTTFWSARSRFSFQSLLTRSSLFSGSTGFRSLPGATWRQELIITMNSGFGRGAPRDENYRGVQEGRERGGYLPSIRGVGRLGKRAVAVPTEMVKALARQNELRDEMKAKAEAVAEARRERERQETATKERIEGLRRLRLEQERIEKRRRQEKAEQEEHVRRWKEMESLAALFEPGSVTGQQRLEGLDGMLIGLPEALKRSGQAKKLAEWLKMLLVDRERALWEDHNEYRMDVSSALVVLSDLQRRVEVLQYELETLNQSLKENGSAREWESQMDFRRRLNERATELQAEQVALWNAVKEFDGERAALERWNRRPMTEVDKIYFYSEGGRWVPQPSDF